ncbi:RNA exonuclease 4 [Aaosphaeria arxii CBS 175.79]|uniref:RNA exonuclease 4 n=1 Tax=Aaosphaeria arxii CBS 175.79 TaxID=1450172 RepID=A0A6A5XB84_9PLEO|nr:RNA exonuclease 4 [Aaosphaeria arxii CBS 175.79]KAF2010057.1 RNA exonuclease 4 [Aaosphaeria arxii CBS 175.79]
MAPIELKNLSSNWKKLQKTLQPSSKSASSKPEEKSDHTSLKRKRATQLNGEHERPSSTHLRKHIKPEKSFATHKRQKMEEPNSVGASSKHKDSRALSRSISMPSLKHPPLLSDPKAVSKSASVLAPSPDHPDIENEGVSETALPGKYVAIDCEMVGTGPEPDRDSALARVSVVNFHGHQVYDSYVQVKVPVTDYRTAVSGIEPKHLRRDFARPFKEVQEDIQTLLSNRILVGHGVKNDLDVLILKHDKRFIRDTSKYSKFREISLVPGRTPGLKHLVEKRLGVEIQTGAHSSVEDARATMALFRLEKEGFEEEITKLYGLTRLPGRQVAEPDADGEVRRKKNKPKKKKKKH